MTQLAAYGVTSNAGFYRIDSLWHFFKQHIEVISILTALVLWGVIAAQHDYLTDRIVAQPRKSDFFYVDYHAIKPNSDFSFRYVPMKVTQVKNDSVIFKVGNIAHAKPVSPNKHAMYDSAMQRNYYRDEPLELTNEQIKALFSSGAIYAARRPDNIYIDGWVVIPKNEVYVE